MSKQRVRHASMCVGIVMLIASKIYAVSLLDTTGTTQTQAVPEPGEVQGNFWVNIGVSVGCTLFAGLMSGLTIGLASIDRLSLEVDSIGNPEVQKMCNRIFPVIDRHHWMLVTLLLCNAAAMETLPIFLDKIVTPVEAVIISVSLVLIFGEIIPQALCTGPKQLSIAYWCCPIVYGLMWMTVLISRPIGWLLDKLLGEHKFMRYDNDQLKKLVMLHSI
jgi:metal transporter CNNM